MTVKPQSTACSRYIAPKSGIFALIPSPWIPYAELMRLDKTAGYYAFYWHYAIGLGFAACTASPIPPPQTVIALAVQFALWVLILRGAVCTWNDNLDQNFDRKIARTQWRPIARGAVSTAQGHFFAVVQLVVGAVFLTSMPRECVYHAASITTVLIVYPLGKRFTHFPQVILGVGFAMAIFMSCAALGVNISFSSPASGDMQRERAETAGAICLFAACLLWTVIFDTVYAHQDVEDDVRAGVRSLAVLLGSLSKIGLSAMAAVQCFLLVATGSRCNFSPIYFVVSCGGTAAVLATMLIRINLACPASCAWWFGPGSRLVGASIVGGLVGEYWLRW